MKHHVEKHACTTPECRRRAVYLAPGWNRVKARKDHGLCRQCYRTLVEKLRNGHEGQRAQGRPW